jgi:hypothetical protein
MSKRLKAADVYSVANYTRDQFRGLLAELKYEFEDYAQTQRRVARTYSPHDFLVILVACELDRSIGFKRSTIAALLPLIARELSGPRPVASQPKLLLTTNPPTARYVDGLTSVEEGTVFPLASVFARADAYLEVAGRGLPTSQTRLNFGPSLIIKTASANESETRVLRRVQQ